MSKECGRRVSFATSCFRRRTQNHNSATTHDSKNTATDAPTIIPIAAGPRSDKSWFCVDVVEDEEPEVVRDTEVVTCELEIVGSDPSRELDERVTDSFDCDEVDDDLVEDVAFDEGVGSGVGEEVTEMSAVSAFRKWI